MVASLLRGYGVVNSTAEGAGSGKQTDEFFRHGEIFQMRKEKRGSRAERYVIVRDGR